MSTGWGDGSLRQQKVQNQRRLREELLLAIVERLQDNVDLIVDVFKADPSSLQTNWFIETPKDQEGLLTGFSFQNRTKIVQHLSCMLDEMDMAQPEDFFMSPSQVQQYVQPHGELQMALSFCRTLVQMAVQASDDANADGRWNVLDGLRPAMGIVAMDSPTTRRRGGDTSVFSWPTASADTPMTSNVSFSTTIASSQQKSIRPPFHADGLKIRHTVEIVSTLIQKLTLCCQELARMDGLKTDKTVRLTRDIKRNYLQLIAVDHHMLRALVDSFELDVLPASLSQIVSNDEDEEVYRFWRADANSSQNVVMPPPQVVRNTHTKATGHSRPVSLQSISSSSHDLFSPQTQDMMSVENLPPATVPEEYDDLRRQMGSVDYDDFEECRDGSEHCERE